MRLNITNATKGLAVALCLLVSGSAAAQQTPVTKPNYELAARFSAKKVGKMVFSTSVQPNWFQNSDKFWYTYKTPQGAKYYIVDPVAGTRKELWDMVDLAARLSLIIKDPFEARNLSLYNVRLKDDKYIRFDVYSSEMVPKEDENGKKDPKKKVNRVYRMQYDIATGNLIDATEQIKKEAKEKKDAAYPRWANVSPDLKYAVFSRNYNLYYMDMENLKKAMKNEKDSTIVEHQLTTDGIEGFGYGSTPTGPYTKDKDRQKRSSAYGSWSPDSRYFVMSRSDRRMIKDLWVVNVLAEPRPKLESYSYQMPGEPGPRQYIVLFDMNDKSHKVLSKLDAYKDQSISIHGKRYTKQERTADFLPSVWLGDNSKFYMTRSSRDLKRFDICSVDINTGEASIIIPERMNPYIETQTPRLINKGSELIHWSERDGWGHLYRYGTDGTLKNQITKGEFHVNGIVGLDEEKGVVYFTACGGEKGEHPYYTHLYRINLDGSGLKLLNKGNFNHTAYISDNSKFFVDNYSRVDTTPKSALFDQTGRKIMDLEEADLSLLFQAGYKFPEIFTVKAGDGLTDLYGVMYKPFDFDSTKSYPIIEYVYPGPQTEESNISWSPRMERIDRLAQVGFIVITVGNRGGDPHRSKWYHTYGYDNLRDYGLEDKKVAVQQLAARHKFIDENRVGIHGHSGGGFMSTAAILMYPDFFKAAVSCAGNHDNNIYNRWWSETHHGIQEKITEKGDTTFKYSIKTNQAIANRLKGNLLLVHGDIDNNVHPGNTLRVVNALIRANKRFDMLILPGQRHSFGDMTEYFFWRMADHFSKYLLGESETDIDISQMNNN